MKNTLETFLFLSILTAVGVEYAKTNYYIELFISFLPHILVAFFSILLIALAFNHYRKTSITYKVLLAINFLIAITYAWQPLNFYYLSSNGMENKTETETISIVTANLWWENDKYEDLETFIVEQDADILGLIEITDIQFNEMLSYFRLNYPYSTVALEKIEEPFAGNVVLSKYPINTFSQKFIDGYYSGMLDAEITIDGEVLEYYLVHTTAPISQEHFKLRNDQLQQIAKLVLEEENQNIIISGDFNISPWSHYYSTFENELENKVKNQALGSGFDTSWTHRSYPLAKSHIDHTFSTNELDVLDYNLLEIPGSDHKAQVIQVKL